MAEPTPPPEAIQISVADSFDQNIPPMYFLTRGAETARVSDPFVVPPDQLNDFFEASLAGGALPELPGYIHLGSGEANMHWTLMAEVYPYRCIPCSSAYTSYGHIPETPEGGN